MNSPPFIEEKPPASVSKIDVFGELWKGIRARSTTANGPLVAAILKNPETAIKSPLRQELMLIVYRSLEKLGYVGTTKGQRIELLLGRELKESEGGGDF